MSCSRASFLSSHFFPSRCLLELKWFFKLLLFKHSCLRQPRQKSLPLETLSGSFRYFFTRFSGLTVFSTVSTAPQLLRFPQGGLAAILRFHAKSEGLGDFSLLNSETTQTSTSWPGSWESSGLLPELSTAAGPLLLLVGPLSLDSVLLLGPAVDDSI